MSDFVYKEVIELLSDGEFHSGEVLGEALGVSRAAIWKRLQSLNQYGIFVESVKGLGYRIPGGISVLDTDQLTLQINSTALPQLHRLLCFDIIDSTNDYLLQRDSRRGDVCLAEWQSAGRGRRGRSWFSPFGKNLYFSICWSFDQGVSALEGLSLAVGVLIAEALYDLGIKGVQLKWPNDLLLFRDGELSKLGGILIDVGGDLTGECKAIIGIGLNVAMSDVISVEDRDSVSQSWSDLRIAGYDGNRHKLAATLLSKLLPALSLYSDQGFAAYQKRWMALNAYQNMNVTLHLSGRVVSGCMLGVDSKGALRLLVDGEEEKYNGGEVSVRLDKDRSN